jgi:hypothetical protein
LQSTFWHEFNDRDSPDRAREGRNRGHDLAFDRDLYDRILQDKELGPFFCRALPHRWDEHLATMVDFWSSSP